MATRFPATFDDYRARAQQRLPRFLFDYVDGGAGVEQTLVANTKAWQRLSLVQRVLVDVDQVDTSTRLLGRDCALPLVLAPVGLAGMLARRGEVQAARAAAHTGVPFTLSTVGICPLAEVQAVSTTPVWFQLYMMRDRGLVAALLERLWQEGCRTLVFTVDLPVPGMRHRDTRNGLDAKGLLSVWARVQQLVTRPRWIWDVPLRGGPLAFGSLADSVPDAKNLDAFKAWVDAQFDPRVTWQDIHWLREHWNGQLILKGICSEADAVQALATDADALVISNHGGRQLDGVAATAELLPRIAGKVAGKLPLLVDGGIRNGTDIFRALALGAQGVLVGRPWALALAAGGEAALARLLQSWQQELRLTMMLTGTTRIADINPHKLDLTARLTGEQP